ncbi:MAG: hypothetical protein LC732_04870 [Acidobacteria bacterium]|nr:hypothetical protein [Acidobacteriota bacterium]
MTNLAMKSTTESPTLRALCVSMLAAFVFVVVPLYGFGHIHKVPDPPAFDSVDGTDQSTSSCLICRLAHERALDSSSVAVTVRPALAGSATAVSEIFAERGSAGPLTSRGPPLVS